MTGGGAPVKNDRRRRRADAKLTAAAASHFRRRRRRGVNVYFRYYFASRRLKSHACNGIVAYSLPCTGLLIIYLSELILLTTDKLTVSLLTYCTCQKLLVSVYKNTICKLCWNLYYNLLYTVYTVLAQTSRISVRENVFFTFFFQIPKT